MWHDQVQKEYDLRINRVLNFIIANISGALPLSELAGIANYSPFHFQRIFKEVIGETPKQFITRVRLENAAHSLMALKDKPIADVAHENGFSSSSTFARAFKSYFGVTAAAFRDLSIREHALLRQKLMSHKNLSQQDTASAISTLSDMNIPVEIRRVPRTRVAFINTDLFKAGSIEQAFIRLKALAEAHNLSPGQTTFLGILHPHSGIYQAGIVVPAGQLLPEQLFETEVGAERYAVCKIMGPISHIFRAFHFVNDYWLPLRACRLKHLTVFEELLHDPLKFTYAKLERKVYIPIEPASAYAKLTVTG